jgi:nicotinamide mononucleotide transporter
VESVFAILQTPAVGPVTWAELFGDVTGALCVWLVWRQHLWNWPLGLLNNVFFLLIFWWSRLYADAILQIAFAAIGVYGWINWVRGTVGNGKLPVRRTTGTEWMSLALVTGAATAALATWLATRTDSPAPVVDASILTLSLAATYGQARKLVESWWIWIAVDLISVPLYVRRGLYPTAALYLAFLVMCVFGLRAWLRDLRAPSMAALP